MLSTTVESQVSANEMKRTATLLASQRDSDAAVFVSPYDLFSETENGDGSDQVETPLSKSGGSVKQSGEGHGPSSLLSTVVWIGLAVFIGVVAFVLSATQGADGRLLANQTPANYIYVMLMQLTLLLWLIALVFRVMESYK